MTGCSKKDIPVDQGWSSPIKVTETKDTLVDGVNLSKWHGKIIAFQGFDPEIARDVSARCFLMDSGNDKSNAWTEVPLDGVPQGYVWAYPAIDQASDKVFFEQGYTENDQLVMNVLVGRMAGRIAVRDTIEKQWVTDPKALFGKTYSNVRLSERNEPGKRERLSGLGLGIVNGQDMYIPYCLEGFTYDKKGVAIAREPNCSGVFHSADSGATWQPERVSDSYDALPSMSRTKNFYYYFAVSLPTGPGHVWELWFSRKTMDGNSWDVPKVVTKTFARSALVWKYVAGAEDDTVHLCWLDSRHEKKRLNLVYPNRENYEVIYCRRKDSDSDWSQDVILSEGMLYSFSPTMSIEGNNVVVAWAGVPTARDGHSVVWPNDIYYRTSKDGGKTWGKLLKLTDGAKDGIISGDPQVMLLNGVIHLFYIQGRIDNHQSRSPWPIYYQQRPFPS